MSASADLLSPLLIPIKMIDNAPEQEEKNLNSYTLQAICSECGRRIEIDFRIRIVEKQPFGRRFNYYLETLPEYLEKALDGIQQNFDYKRGNFRMVGPRGIDPIAPLCKNCRVIKKLDQNKKP